MNKETLIEVKNATNGRVGYLIPDLNNFHRNFMPNETKQIPFEEIQKLSFSPGGEYILRHQLIIKNQEALDTVLGAVEPEYFYTEKEVEQILLNGTIDELMDFLDFAPDGMINLAKDIAVKKEIPDVRKRDAILNKTGFNVTKAIEFNHMTEEEDDAGMEKIRRTTPITQKTATTEETMQKRAPQKYKVVTK